jgi:hypothetical protein
LVGKIKAGEIHCEGILAMSISRRTFLKTTGTLLALPAIIRAEAGPPSIQQQRLNMEITRIGSQASVQGPTEYFTGSDLLFHDLWLASGTGASGP